MNRSRIIGLALIAGGAIGLGACAAAQASDFAKPSGGSQCRTRQRAIQANACVTSRESKHSQVAADCSARVRGSVCCSEKSKR